MSPHTCTEEERAAGRCARGLIAIGAFKLLEALFFVLVGVGAFHFLHRDLADAILRAALALRVDPEGRLVSLALDHLNALTAQRLREIGVATFIYAALRVTEGIGLVLQQVWAEYLTVALTLSFLPWELYELAVRPDWFRIWLFVLNLVVLAYLVWYLRRRRNLPAPVTA